MNEYLKIILKEMCKRVGADYDKIDFKSKGWFRKYSWREKDEEDFKQWLIEFLNKNKKAKQELMRLHSHKSFYEKFANQFLFNYGWKTI